MAQAASSTTSHVTKSSRSNLMAVRHTVQQVYGWAAEIHVTDLVTLTAPATRENN